MNALVEQGRKLTTKKKSLYGKYQNAKKDMQEVTTAKANIDDLFGYKKLGRKNRSDNGCTV